MSNLTDKDWSTIKFAFAELSVAGLVLNLNEVQWNALQDLVGGYLANGPRSISDEQLFKPNFFGGSR